ncbi:MAG: enoyl-CoA hydratase-related protein [Chloroherpetonaceae bacterium]|nr:enoyl-CoA hydratase-related protein [Chthonomonadaceae bacterium]MDW8206231.1 enoyl-CoA hydratase-related protein [Chloroherpetonaceae bacterium]
MEYATLHVEQQGPLVQITLNRPEVHNAFDEVLIAELTDAFARLGAQEDVRVVVLQGAGASFCAGADLNWMRRVADYSHAQNLEDAAELERMFATIATCPAVTIARVHGAAIGGGAGLVAVADIAIASEETVFAFSEVRLGIAPAVIAPYVLQKVGAGVARAWFVTGERFRAGDAWRAGLVQQVVPITDMDAAVLSRVKAVLQAGPGAVAAVKRLLREITGLTPEQASTLTTACIATLRVSPEGQEGIRAFLEKRRPRFAQE